MSAELQEQVAQFVKHYYELINENPSLAHTLYHMNADFCWPTDNGTTMEITTAKDVEKFFAKQRIYKFLVDNSFAQSSQTSVLLVVRGRTGGIGLEKPNSSFVQTFYLEESDGQLLVRNDILSVIPDAQPEDKDEPSAITKVSIADPNPEDKNERSAIPNISIAAGTKLGKKSGEGVIPDPSKAITSLGTRSLKKSGKGVVSDPSKANRDTQLIVRKSRFGRNLKPSKRIGDVYEPQFNQKDAPAVEEFNQKDAPAVEELREKSTVLIIYDDRMLNHVQPQGPDLRSPEVPDRLTHIIDQFRRDGLYARCDFKNAEPATNAQLELVHKPDYVEFVGNLPAMSQDDKKKYVETSMYFTEGEGTKLASFIAAGSVVKACDLVAQNKYKRAFAVVRPPGHHARESTADGYCILNNAAIGAAHLRNNCLLKKVLVVDIDVHHGNGTQSMFYNNNGVLFISVHSSILEYPEGPERGIEFIGEGAGKGFNINIPLSGNYGDGDLFHVWNQIVLPVAKEFDPDMIIISAGYDAAKGDAMGGCNVTQEGYATLTSMLGEVGTGRMIMVLEGGYNLEVTAHCASHSVRALLGDVDVLRERRRIVPRASTKKTVLDVKSAISKYWEVFKDFRTDAGV